MTTATRESIIGAPVDRVDGPLKVTGAAPYPSDFTFPDLTHAVLVQSTIAAGRITGIDAARAEATPDVLAVITHENAPALVEAQMTPLGPSPPFPLSGTTGFCTRASMWPSSWRGRANTRVPRRDWSTSTRRLPRY
jgi:xanthine dehydrogenase YagR molybdenum-binding subunit